MNSIAIDFKNEMMCIMRPGQQGTEHINGLGITKEKLADFIPEKYRNRQSFTWNFEDGTFAVNADYEYHPERGEIMTMDCFVPEVILPMLGLLERQEDFLALIGYEEVDIKDLINEWELPPELEDFKKLFGL